MDPLYSYSVGIAQRFPHHYSYHYRHYVILLQSKEVDFKILWHSKKTLKVWLHSLLSGISMPTPMPTMILCNNNAAIDLSDDPLLHTHVKHINIKYHFLRERFQSHELAMTYINTKDNLADIFTKPLELQHFSRLWGFLGLLWKSDIHARRSSVYGEEECWKAHHRH